MKTNQVRQEFLKFFESKGHAVIESDSLVPKNDPTVLFTTAGMQQFKKNFLGQDKSLKRAASSQKCLRTDDLTEVGKTNFHHTFFEMLGNFSFGDYFKEEAILWAWAFLTQNLKIPQKKLWVSVYKDDAQARKVWLDKVKIPADKLIALGDKSNFWPANAKTKGPNGPCGPCSEIFYDYGPNPKCAKKKCDPSCDCGRFSEVWNLVFTQFNRKDNGVLEDLPNTNIDTGMGLERLAAVLQGKQSNFEIDLFQPILKAVDDQIKITVKTHLRNERYVIADHIRAIVFGIADGVVPSNEGRGYVIKKLIIDVTDIMLRNGAKKPCLHLIVPAVVEAMGDPYPEIKDKQKNISETVRGIENSYMRVRQKRMPELKTKILEACSSASLKNLAGTLGELYFVYHDRYGLTVGSIEDTVDEAQKGLPDKEQKKLLSAHASALKIYGERMESQKSRSRSSSKMTGDVFVGTELTLDAPKTKFVGYEESVAKGTVLQLFINDKQSEKAKKGDAVKIILDRTPFYAEAGGQVGDTGMISSKTGSVTIEDTQKIDDIYIHLGKIQQGTLKTKDKVEARIDEQRRISIMRNHTATHLVQYALREILGDHVQQQGSLVAEDKLRFDFTHPKAITRNEIMQIEKLVNNCICACDEVAKEVLPLNEAKRKGALAFFAEKYGQKVRIVSIGNYSKEFCGGTHLKATGEIGLFKIVSETAIAQGIRRIEAVTGKSALKYVQDIENRIENLAKILKSPSSEITQKAEMSVKKIKALEKNLEKYQFDAIKSGLDKIIEKGESIGNVKIINHVFQDADINVLKKVSDVLKQKAKSAVLILGARSLDSVSVLVSVSDDLVKKGVRANDLVNDIAPLINGKGGGRPQLAQAGSRENGNLDEALKQANRLVKNKITS